MKKKIKSAVISIVVIAVLLLAILTGVKNGAIDKLTKRNADTCNKSDRNKKIGSKMLIGIQQRVKHIKK